MKRTVLAALFCSAALTACGGGRDRGPVVVVPAAPRPVSIEVEVFDPVSGFVWQDVGVRVVEAYNEWSNLFVETPLVDAFYYTDENGLVYLDEFLIADAAVGFAEDIGSGAILESLSGRDEATVTLEVWGPGFTPVFVDVVLTWDEPDVFISVPFE